MNKQRWRNGALWASIISQVLLLAQLFGNITGIYELTEQMSGEVLTLMNTILGLLVILGIVSNPTRPDSSGYNL
ncbi:putative membrane protein [Paenibacillus sp. DS2015]|uniref:phage holin n=1 Tax=Paenibacillus sp. DS2015 TaxID=3373917 RepID=UPI003D1D6BD5